MEIKRQYKEEMSGLDEKSDLKVKVKKWNNIRFKFLA